MKLSIFGATGFIGQNFSKRFPNHVLIPKHIVSPKTKNILYFISTSHDYNIYEDLKLDVETNLLLLCKVLEKCKKKDLVFNYISTMNVYGLQENLPINEQSYCNPEGLYAITKKCAEDIIITFCKTFDVNYRILRLCNVLGMHDKISTKKNSITWMINQLKLGKNIDLYNGGEVFKEVMYIDDVCDAINLVCQKGNKNEIYNIGSGEAMTLKKIIEESKRILNSPSKITIKNNIQRSSHSIKKNFWLDTSKLNSLGFEKKFSLYKIIKEL